MFNEQNLQKQLQNFQLQSNVQVPQPLTPQQLQYQQQVHAQHYQQQVQVQQYQQQQGHQQWAPQLPQQFNQGNVAWQTQQPMQHFQVIDYIWLYVPCFMYLVSFFINMVNMILKPFADPCVTNP